MSFFSNLFAKFEGIPEEVWETIEPILENDAKTLLSLAVQLATPIVTGLDTDTSKTPEQKFEAAVEQVAAAAKVQGESLLLSTIQTAVQLVVTKLRSTGK